MTEIRFSSGGVSYDNERYHMIMQRVEEIEDATAPHRGAFYRDGSMAVLGASATVGNSGVSGAALMGSN